MKLSVHDLALKLYSSRSAVMLSPSPAPTDFPWNLKNRSGAFVITAERDEYFAAERDEYLLAHFLLRDDLKPAFSLTTGSRNQILRKHKALMSGVGQLAEAFKRGGSQRMNSEITSRGQTDFFRKLSCALLICSAAFLTQINAEAQSGALLASDADGEQEQSHKNDAGSGQVRVHRHEPVIVRSKPVIERLPVSVIEPVDIVSTESGTIYVADRKAETVFRLSTDGHVDALVKSTPGITRITIDQSNNLYVLLVESKASRIVQYTPTGLIVEVAAFPFEATAMVRLASGEFVVNSASSRNLTISSPESINSVLTTMPGAITDIALNSSGQIHVLHPDGHISYVGLDGGITEFGNVTPGCTRLFSLPEGQLAGLSPESVRVSDSVTSTRAEIQTAIRMDEAGPTDTTETIKPHVYATVPPGTAAVSFDRMGNLSMVNPALRAVTRVTSTFMIPCPHCGKPVRLILSPEGPAAPNSRSF